MTTSPQLRAPLVMLAFGLAITLPMSLPIVGVAVALVYVGIWGPLEVLMVITGVIAIDAILVLALISMAERVRPNVDESGHSDPESVSAWPARDHPSWLPVSEPLEPDQPTSPLAEPSDHLN